MSIEHADFDGIERLAAVTGGEITSTFDRPDLSTLGECDLIDEIMVRTAQCRTVRHLPLFYHLIFMSTNDPSGRFCTVAY